MRTFRKWRTIAIVAFTILIAKVGLPASIAEARACEDFLDRWHNKPIELKFLGCRASNKEQVDHVAVYKFEGMHVEKVFDFLQSEFDLQTLQFSCCEINLVRHFGKTWKLVH